MNSNLHPTIARSLAPFAPPGSEVHRIAADLAYNEDKAHRMNNEAFIRSMQAQINDKTTGVFE